MRLRARLAAALRPPARGAGPRLPLRVWPADEAAWLDENGVRHPRAARRTLAALASLGPAAGTRPGSRAGARS
ncbi:hypothetical protein ACU4GA_24820 [Methylobacterium oryzae CBMB20]